MAATALITSTSNPRIKQIRALARHGERQATALCVVEGIFHTGEALAAGAVDYLVYAPDLLASDFGRGLVAQADAKEIPVYRASAEVMRAVSSRDNPQGLLAVARQRRTQLDELSAEKHPWLVAVIAPQDPGNVGTILRTIDAAGASGLLLLDGGVDPYHSAAIRASMATIFHLPVASASFEAFVSWARAGHYRVYGTSAHGQVSYREMATYKPPLVLLMGSEREGLTTTQADICDELIRLPMHGRASSLNLAVATGIFIYGVHDSLAAQGYFSKDVRPST